MTIKKVKGPKVCTIGANCKSTCISGDYNCQKVKADKTVKAAFDKIKKPSNANDKNVAAFRESPSIPKAAKLLSGLFEKADKVKDYEVTGKNSLAIQEAAKQFESMTNTRLKNFFNEKPGVGSSNNTRTGEIILQERTNPLQTKKEVFHELAHSLERSNPKNKQAAIDFINQRKTGEPELLKGSQYKNGEKAYPGNFTNPYTGRYYISGSTEVYATGLEHFYSAKSLVDFYNSDKGHFDVVYEAIKRAQS